MPMQQFPAGLKVWLVLAAVTALGACAQGTFATGAPPQAAVAPATPAAESHSATSSAASSATPASNRLPAFAASRPEPEPELTDQEASAQCWMKFENGRRNVDLDAKAKLVDKCIDEKMHRH